MTRRRGADRPSTFRDTSGLATEACIAGGCAPAGSEPASFPLEGGDLIWGPCPISPDVQREGGREGKEEAAVPGWPKTEKCLATHVPRFYLLSRMTVCFVFHRKVLCNLHIGIVPKQCILKFGIGKKKQTFISCFLCTVTVVYFTFFPFFLVSCTINSN